MATTKLISKCTLYLSSKLASGILVDTSKIYVHLQFELICINIVQKMLDFSIYQHNTANLHLLCKVSRIEF